MAYRPLTDIPLSLFGNSSTMLTGGVLRAYVTGTSTPATLYSDANGTSAGTSVTLDARGEPTTIKRIWLDTAVTYKLTLEDADGNVLWTADPVYGSYDPQSYVANVKNYGAVGDGVADDSAGIQSADAAGRKKLVPYTENGYGIAGTLYLSGQWEFEEGAFFKCLSETLIIVDSDFTAHNLKIDANSQTVTQKLLYLKAGKHRLYNPQITNIKGTGAGAYGIKVNVEGCDTEIHSPVFDQITDARAGSIVGDEGFCGGIYVACDTGSTMTSNGSRVVIRDCKASDIYTTQSDGVTESTSDNDADAIRLFVNDATSGAYINTITLVVDGVDCTDVQKRALKISGCGNAYVRRVTATANRSGSQMSDAVFVSDSRHVFVTGVKAFGKFDNCIKLDGMSASGAKYIVRDVDFYSSQAGVGCAIMASDLYQLNIDGVVVESDCERILRFSEVDNACVTNVNINLTKTSTNPIFDIQDCDDLRLSANVDATFTGSTGQILYIQGSNRAECTINGVAQFDGAGGQVIRYNNCTHLTITGINSSNRYNIFDEGSNSCVKIDQWITQTGTNQAVLISATDWLEFNARRLTGDFTGATMSASVVAFANVDHFKVTGMYQCLGMTDAGNDRGITFTDCTRGTVDVETFSGGTDAEMLRFVTSSKIRVKSISDSSRPVRFISGTDYACESYAPAGIINGVASELTTINDVSSW